MRSMGIMEKSDIIKNGTAQPDSNISKLVWFVKNSPAQRDSKFSKLKICPSSPLRPSSPLKPKSSPVQQDSKMSSLGICCSTRPSRTVDFGISPRRARGTTPKAIFENSPARQDSNISKFRKNQTLHLLHDLHGEEIYSAQRHYNVQFWDGTYGTHWTYGTKACCKK